MHDLVIRGATMVDGLGRDPIRADVAVKDGRIAAIGIAKSRRVNDLPGGGPRPLHEPLGVHGVFVNGVRVFDGKDYARLGQGPGQVLDRFPSPRAPSRASGAQ